MSLTQYLIAWTVYIAAALGCLLVWGKITASLNYKLASWLRFWAAALVLTPGFTNPEMTWFSPAFLAMIYDGLTHGPEHMTQNAMMVAGGLVVFTAIKLLFFRNPTPPVSKPAKGDTEEPAVKS